MSNGLEGIVAAETVLSHVDGEKGELILAGHPLEEAVARFDHVKVCSLLLRNFSDVPVTMESLGQARQVAFGFLEGRVEAAAGLPPIDGLRALVAGMPDGAAMAPELRLVGALPVFTAALWRVREGLDPVAPDPALDPATDLLRMLRGRLAEAGEAKALDTYLVTAVDHGFNASTFAARVVASTHAGLVASVTAALAALKGPLHGGAPGPVLDMFDAIERLGGDEAAAERWVDGELAAGRRLMGFGHRVYRVRDPRADVLKAAVASLGGERIAFAERIERVVLAKLKAYKPDRPLDTNTEYYTALLLERLGLPRALFTPVFAIGRVAGWTAHALEQVATGRLIRPQSRYIGPMPLRAA